MRLWVLALLLVAAHARHTANCSCDCPTSNYAPGLPHFKAWQVVKNQIAELRSQKNCWVAHGDFFSHITHAIAVLTDDKETLFPPPVVYWKSMDAEIVSLTRAFQGLDEDRRPTSIDADLYTGSPDIAWRVQFWWQLNHEYRISLDFMLGHPPKKRVVIRRDPSVAPAPIETTCEGSEEQPWLICLASVRNDLYTYVEKAWYYYLLGRVTEPW